MSNSTGCFEVPAIRTVTGKRVSLTKPHPDSIDIEDIAVGLSNTCRFGGQTYKHYSVAEHSIACCENAERVGEPIDVQLALLLHDAPEAYLGDIIRPLKLIIGDIYKDLEEMFQAAIDEAFFIDTFRLHDVIKVHDNAVCEAEMRAICPREYMEVKSQFDELNLGESRADWFTPEFLGAEEASTKFKHKFAKTYQKYLFMLDQHLLEGRKVFGIYEDA